MSNPPLRRIFTVSNQKPFVENSAHVLAKKNLENQFCIVFSVNQIIQEMLDAYKVVHQEEDRVHPEKIKKIHNQVSVDYPRMHVYYNSVNPNTVESYLFMLRKLKNMRHSIMPSMYHVVILFSMQAPFFYHFSYLNNSLPEIEDVYLVQDESHATVEVIHRNEHINLILKKSFKRINIKTGDIHDRYDTTMMINLHENFSYGTLTWHQNG